MQDSEKKSPLVLVAKTDCFQNPKRCSDTQELARDLPNWLVFGEEIESYPDGHLSGSAKMVALSKLLPKAMEEKIQDMIELDTFDKRLKWARSQIQHVRSVNMAQQVSWKGPVPMDIGAVVQGAEEQHRPQEGSQSAGADQKGEWFLNGVWNALSALSKGKGKGKGKGKDWEAYGGAQWTGGKGELGKGGLGKGGKGGGQFQGACNHCGA